MLCVRLWLDGARRGRLKSIGFTQLGILTESLIHSDSFDTTCATSEEGLDMAS